MSKIMVTNFHLPAEESQLVEMPLLICHSGGSSPDGDGKGRNGLHHTWGSNNGPGNGCMDKGSKGGSGKGWGSNGCWDSNGCWGSNGSSKGGSKGDGPKNRSRKRCRNGGGDRIDESILVEVLAEAFEVDGSETFGSLHQIADN